MLQPNKPEDKNKNSNVSLTWLFVGKGRVAMTLVHPGITSCHVTVRWVACPGPQSCVVISLPVLWPAHCIIWRREVTARVTRATPRKHKFIAYPLLNLTINQQINILHLR